MITYGKTYVTIFHALLDLDSSHVWVQATKAEKRALNYFVRAKDFNALTEFSSTLVLTTRNPQQLRKIIADLRLAVEKGVRGNSYTLVNIVINNREGV